MNANDLIYPIVRSVDLNGNGCSLDHPDARIESTGAITAIDYIAIEASMVFLRACLAKAELSDGPDKLRQIALSVPSLGYDFAEAVISESERRKK